MSWRALRLADWTLPLRVTLWYASTPSTLLIAAAAVLLLVSVLAGQTLLMAAALLGAAFAWFTFRQPAPAALLALLFASDVFKFAEMVHFPAVKLGGGGRLNPADLTVLMLLALGLIHLYRRRERPMFTVPLLLFGGMVGISFVLGVVGGSIGVSAGINGLRSLSGYLMYVGLAGLINTRRKLNALLVGLFGLMLVSVAIQVVEAYLGHRLTTPWSVVNDYYSRTLTVQIGGLTAPYLWNRATGFLLVSQLLALGALLWTRRTRFVMLSAVALLGFVIALMRQWYLMIALGTVVIMLLPRKGRWRSIAGLGALLAAFLGVFALLAASGLATQYSLLEVWVGRLGSVLHYQSDSNYIARIFTWQAQMNLFRAAPLFGYGPGSLPHLEEMLYKIYFSDTGIPNTLVQYGAFGTAAVGVLILAFAVSGYKAYQRLRGSQDQGYVAGLLGAWIAIAAGYSFGFDFFSTTELIYAVGLSMVLLDRFAALGGPPTAPTRQPR